MLLTDALCSYLKESGVHHVFGVPGYANYPFYQSMENQKLKVILTRHEGGASWMAYGYAQAGNKKFGVCTGTSGAGTTNLISGVAAAYANSIPMLVVTGQVETSKFGKGAFQEMSGYGPRGMDAVAVLGKMTKFSAMIKSADDFYEIMSKAHRAMFEGRPGPVHINIPIDIQRKPALAKWSAEISKPNISSQTIDAAKKMISNCKAPLILIGRGCRHSVSLLSEFVESTQIPFCTTIQGKGILSHEVLDFGVVGVAGSLRANTFVKEKCDLLICLGTSLNEFTTNGFADYFSQVPKLRVDIDAQEIEKCGKPALGVHGDVGEFLNFMLEDKGFLRASQVDRNLIEWTMSVPKIKETLRDRDVDNLIAPMDVIRTVEECSPDNTFFTADSGNNAVWAVHELTVKKSQNFLIDINTGCMGSGIVSAIGIKAAAPERPVIAICGDGGFMMNGMDVGTAADYGFDVTWVVMNDQKLGMVTQGGNEKYGTDVGTHFVNANIAAMGAAFGATSVQVNTQSELQEALNRRSEIKGPYVIDVRVNDRYLPSVYSRTQRTAEDEALLAQRISQPKT